MTIKIKWDRTEKQIEAWDYLFNNITTVLFFGGGAGGAKSFLGCAWIILVALKFNGTRWFLARKTLKSLRESTLETFFQVCGNWGIKPEKHYKYNSQLGFILFNNGSKIVLLELSSKPSDPNFEGVGSTEYTGGFIDESTQVAEKGVEAMMSRIRFRLDDFVICQACRFMGEVPKKIKEQLKNEKTFKNKKCPKCGKMKLGTLIPKLFLTGNPAKNWTYREYYKKDKDGTIEPYKHFIQSLVVDNKFISKHYIENLKKMKNRAMRERLLYGNWEWDDDEAKLMEYNNILDLFTNEVEDDDTLYISCDVARRGVDRTVVMLWRGLQVIEIIVLPKEQYYKTTQISIFLKTYARRHKVPRSNIVIDEGGVGGGVVDEMEDSDGHNQVYAFNGASRAIEPRYEEWEDKTRQKLNYGNLRGQCYDALGKLVMGAKISILTEDSQIKDDIIEELSQVKQKDIDKDGKFFIIPKEKIKEDLGRSPDFADCLMMRMVFDLGINENPEEIINDIEFDF